MFRISDSTQFDGEEDDDEEESDQKGPGQWFTGGSFWRGGLSPLPLLDVLGGGVGGRPSARGGGGAASD
jgi:hypothetical protein